MLLYKLRMLMLGLIFMRMLLFKLRMLMLGLIFMRMLLYKLRMLMLGLTNRLLQCEQTKNVANNVSVQESV